MLAMFPTSTGFCDYFWLIYNICVRGCSHTGRVDVFPIFPDDRIYNIVKSYKETNIPPSPPKKKKHQTITC